jgi:hypothetical protein
METKYKWGKGWIDPGQRFSAEKVWSVWYEPTIKSVVAATMNLLFYLNLQREVLMCAVSVAVSKHVSRYGPQSGFSFYNLTTPPPAS